MGLSRRGWFGGIVLFAVLLACGGWWWISLDPSVVSVNDALNDYQKSGVYDSGGHFHWDES